MFVSFFVGLFADSSYGDHLPKSRIAPSTPEKTDQMKSDHQSPELSGVPFLALSQSQALHRSMQLVGGGKNGGETVLGAGVFQ